MARGAVPASREVKYEAIAAPAREIELEFWASNIACQRLRGAQLKPWIETDDLLEVTPIGSTNAAY
ncbi:hypothetical protein GCM10010862_44740 [Devosia nitrariae]|uniref:Uncharacterized protein n=1 Tax=Devosia nitrariae TaxID=2071872 RepID=A0ABQ5WAS4_9HYPH|nr:hypothetical protein GCM10010862_44740 [Devosia nitrariae]